MTDFTALYPIYLSFYHLPSKLTGSFLYRSEYSDYRQFLIRTQGCPDGKKGVPLAIPHACSEMQLSGECIEGYHRKLRNHTPNECTNRQDETRPRGGLLLNLPPAGIAVGGDGKEGVERQAGRLVDW